MFPIHPDGNIVRHFERVSGFTLRKNGGFIFQAPPSPTDFFFLPVFFFAHPIIERETVTGNSPFLKFFWGCSGDDFYVMGMAIC
jgi:hypothetical protein